MIARVCLAVALLLVGAGPAVAKPCPLRVPDRIRAEVLIPVQLTDGAIDHPGLILMRFDPLPGLPAMSQEEVVTAELGTLLHDYHPRAMRRFNVDRSTTVLIDRPGLYAVVLLEHLRDSWPAELPDDIGTGSEVCRIAFIAGGDGQHRIFETRWQGSVAVSLWSYRQDVPGTRWFREVGAAAYVRYENPEFGLGIRQSFAPGANDVAAFATYHDAWAKGIWGGEVAVNSLSRSGGKPITVGPVLEIRTPPLIHRPFWVTLNVRGRVTGPSTIVPPWAFSIGFRYDLVPLRRIE
jgi:hypothetical protein